MHFLQFCADLTKKSKSIKAIYIYASERSRYALSENGTVYYAMTYCKIPQLWAKATNSDNSSYFSRKKTL